MQASAHGYARTIIRGPNLSVTYPTYYGQFHIEVKAGIAPDGKTPYVSVDYTLYLRSG